ncbi:MAG: hypothetical protein KDF67_21435, partial [Ottowia sp.]|nr:hypothetical protein [Ottowia sp.]
PQLVGTRFHGGWPTRVLDSGAPQCPWLLVDVDARAAFNATPHAGDWELVQSVRRPTDDNDTLLVYR